MKRSPNQSLKQWATNMPAKSKKQRKFMGMVHATQKGEIKAPSKAVAKAAKTISKKSAKDFAKTKEKGLPVRKGKKPTRAQVKKSLKKTKGY